MPPEEKAQEIISTYRFILSVPGAPLGDKKDMIAKQCALAQVDEILDLMDRVSDVSNNYFRGTASRAYTDAYEEYKYWKCVRKKIDKMAC